MSIHPLLEIGYLLRCLRDKNKDMRYAAAKTLADYGDERAVNPLIEALQDEFSNVRTAAATALGELADIRAVEPLLNSLKDEVVEVRMGAAGALGNLADARAIEPLLNLITDKNWNIKMSASSALASFKQDKRAVAAVNHFRETEKFPYASRQFVYRATPGEIKDYLITLGYEVEEIHHQETGEIIGFSVVNTTVKLGYNLEVNGRLVGYGMLGVRNSPEITEGSVEIAENSLKLYNKLYRRFRKS